MAPRFFDITPRLRFVEREVQSDSNPSMRRNAKILQQYWRDRFDEEREGEWRDIPLEPEDHQPRDSDNAK